MRARTISCREECVDDNVGANEEAEATFVRDISTLAHQRHDSAATTDSSGPTMFDLTFLGTSASVPSADRNYPGVLVEAGGHRIMVDCGEGTQR
jgi:hypothetical protein